MPKVPAEFWKPHSIKALAKLQKKQPARDFDALVGKGKGLWKNDQEFEAFVARTSGSGEAAHR